ncbi:hypothetical protein [Geminocystis sp. GBBB08]|uniref:hypothetical protein n=1 Tax=Geminocystis sp. GBBB08 TaxID=2604140 RepID=UPI0027E25FB6|nr:hypothetical protein [Geminocystis sp. GBBB08]MBL1209530.1 hypothetical protein [Geminocystis sp. GBBB08]
MKIFKIYRFICVILLSFILILTTNQLKLNAYNSFLSTNEHHHGLILAKISNNDLNYFTNLGLMKGHLLVGKELLNLSEYEQSEPHFGHPVDEIYGDLEPQLKTRNIPAFNQDLITLHELVKFSPQDPKVSYQYDLAMKKIDQAIAFLPESKRQNPEFIIKVITKLLNIAQEEYSAAIITNKIVEIIEYQDAKGFALYSDILFNSIQNNLSTENPSLAKKLALNLKEIKQVFPSAKAPPKAVIAPEGFSQLVSQFTI